MRPTPGTRAAGHGISPGTERLPGDSGPARVGGPSTAHPRPNPKVRRSAPSRSRRSSALQSYATLALYVPHASPLSIAQRPSMRLDTSPRSPRSDPLPHHRRSRVPAGCRCTTSGTASGAQSRAGLPRSASAASASRQATPAITFAPRVSWPVRDRCPRRCRSATMAPSGIGRAPYAAYQAQTRVTVTRAAPRAPEVGRAGRGGRARRCARTRATARGQGRCSPRHRRGTGGCSTSCAPASRRS